MIYPELIRNVWLDFSVHRLIITSSVIGVICYLGYLISPSWGSVFALNLAFLFIFVWGTKNASETVINEVNNHTWDLQRQSSISPWSMTIGKLIGSTLFSWFAVFTCFGIYLVWYQKDFHSLWYSPLQEIIILILGGLFSQGLALSLSLQPLEQRRHHHSIKTFRYFLLAALTGWMSTLVTLAACKTKEALLYWHHFAFSKAHFAFISLILFTGWVVVGLQRSFSKELQYQKTPVMWLLFNLFCVIYFSGFAAISFQFDYFIYSEMQDINQILANAPYYVGFLVAQLLTYCALFTESSTIIRYRKLGLRLREKQWVNALQQFPLWPISLFFAGIMGVICILTKDVYPSSLYSVYPFYPSIFIISSLLFLIRDLFLFHYFYWGRQEKLLANIILYLFILYFLIPLLLSALHLYHFISLFLPNGKEDYLLLTLGGVITQMGFLMWLMKNRLNRAR